MNQILQKLSLLLLFQISETYLMFLQILRDEKGDHAENLINNRKKFEAKSLIVSFHSYQIYSEAVRKGLMMVEDDPMLDSNFMIILSPALEELNKLSTNLNSVEVAVQCIRKMEEYADGCAYVYGNDPKINFDDSLTLPFAYDINNVLTLIDIPSPQELKSAGIDDLFDEDEDGVEFLNEVYYQVYTDEFISTVKEKIEEKFSSFAKKVDPLIDRLVGL